MGVVMWNLSGGGAGGRGAVAPTCRQVGKWYHFTDLVEWCLQVRKRHI